jgi:hypothetical protein
MWELGEDRAVSLYSGSAEEDYWSFAPYLAKCDNDLIDWIVQNLWHDPWGLFVVAEGPLDSLRKHFRRFLLVDDPDGEEMYFRYYDPRVLRKFLPTCSSRELGLLFGEIDAFVSGDEAGTDANLRITRTPGAWSPTPTRFGIGQRLRIGREQMAVFAPEAESAFENKLVKHLREYHTGLTQDLPDGILLDLVRCGIAKARSYGITWESKLTAFVALMFTTAPNFDSHPRVRAILTSAGIDPERKVNVVVAQTPKHVWREIEQHYDAAAWSPSGTAN